MRLHLLGRQLPVRQDELGPPIPLQKLDRHHRRPVIGGLGDPGELEPLRRLDREILSRVLVLLRPLDHNDPELATDLRIDLRGGIGHPSRPHPLRQTCRIQPGGKHPLPRRRDEPPHHQGLARFAAAHPFPVLPRPRRPLTLGCSSNTPCRCWPPADRYVLLAGSRSNLHGVVGYSLGARVALGLVVTGRCARGVLIGVGAWGSATTSARAGARSTARGQSCARAAWPRSSTRGKRSRCSHRRPTRRRGDARPGDASIGWRFESRAARAQPRWGSPRCRIMAARSQTRAIASRYSPAPKTRSTPRSRASCRARRRRGSVPGAGHNPTLEQPVALAGAIARAVQALG